MGHRLQAACFVIPALSFLPKRREALRIHYTAVTRAKKRVLLVGQKKALYMAIQKSGVGRRNTILAERMQLYHRAVLNHVTQKATQNSLKKAS